MRQSLALMFTLLLIVLITVPAGAQGSQADGTLVDGSGKTTGSVHLTEAGNGVTVSVTYAGIPGGQHGIHFHTVGKCDGPDFMTAGGHFNPDNKQHGLQNPQGAHAGDLSNLTSSGTGMQQFSTATNRITLGAGPTSIFDADGTALVIHANPDDEMTDPTGNSGGRIACAVLTRAAPSTATGTTALPATGAPHGTSLPPLPLTLAGIGGVLVCAGIVTRRTASTRQ